MLVTPAPERDLQHAGGGRIEPLAVVDGDDHGPSLGQDPQHVQHGEPDRVRIRRAVAGLGEQQRDLQCPPSQGDERGRRLLEHRGDQLREPGERERSLGLDSTAYQHTAETLAGLLDTSLPEDRLADARLAREHECTRALLDLAQEPLDRAKLLVASDDLRGHARSVRGGRVERRRAVWRARPGARRACGRRARGAPRPC